MSYLHYLCLFAHSDVQHILRCVLCFVSLRLVCPVLPVTLNCPYLIAPSILSKVYLYAQWNKLIMWLVYSADAKTLKYLLFKIE